jgi:superfamily II DNA or RNA helicase
MAVAATKPALVFVSQVGHGQKLMPALTRAGVRAALVWGEHATDERRAALAKLTGGQLDVIVCSSVFQQAVDIPSLRSVVNAAGGASIVQTLQRIGRGTRVTATKKSFEVWDVLDDGHRWLTKHGKQRRDAYEREGYRVEVVEDFAVEKDDPRRDEHGFVLGSAAQAKHRAEVRRDTLRELAGVEGLRNPQRGRVLRPHSLLGYSCTDCGAPVDALPPECSGVPPEAEAQGRLI